MRDLVPDSVVQNWSSDRRDNIECDIENGKERELKERIARLLGSQARIALICIAADMSLAQALDVAETY